jgi:hypothetical protein
MRKLTGVAAATLIVTIAIAAVLPMAASAANDPRAPRGDGAAGCVVADVSGSTRQARPLYVSAFSKFATDIGLHGSGALCLILAAGDPQAEGVPMTTSVAPTHRNPIYAPREVAAAVSTASRQFSELLAHPPVKRAGSAIAESAAVAARGLHRGDHLLLATDGIQSSDLLGDFHRVDLSPDGIRALLTKLSRAGLMPNLEGVTVSMPLLLIHPGGTSMSTAREARVRRFWEVWANHAGATLDTSAMS